MLVNLHTFRDIEANMSQIRPVTIVRKEIYREVTENPSNRETELLHLLGSAKHDNIIQIFA